jgi:hypothetical protein
MGEVELEPDGSGAGAVERRGFPARGGAAGSTVSSSSRRELSRFGESSACGPCARATNRLLHWGHLIRCPFIASGTEPFFRQLGQVMEIDMSVSARK